MTIHYIPDLPRGELFATRYYAVADTILPTKRVALKLVFGRFSFDPDSDVRRLADAKR